MDQPLWRPSPERAANTNLAAFMRHVRGRWDVSASDYRELYQWSITEREQFWQSVWSFCGVIAKTQGGTVVVDGDQMPGARWFPDARLNFAENLLRRRDRAIAIVFRGEDRLAS